MVIREECGVFGIRAVETTDIATKIYYGLYALQHRGQESCGIVVNDDGVFSSHKDTGLVSEVFDNSKLKMLGKGTMGIGHVRVINIEPAVDAVRKSLLDLSEITHQTKVNLPARIRMTTLYALSHDAKF